MGITNTDARADLSAPLDSHNQKQSSTGLVPYWIEVSGIQYAAYGRSGRSRRAGSMCVLSVRSGQKGNVPGTCCQPRQDSTMEVDEMEGFVHFQPLLTSPGCRSGQGHRLNRHAYQSTEGDLKLDETGLRDRDMHGEKLHDCGFPMVCLDLLCDPYSRCPSPAYTYLVVAMLQVDTVLSSQYCTTTKSSWKWDSAPRAFFPCKKTQFGDVWV